MKQGDLIFIQNCYGLSYNTLAIFDRFDGNFFYFISPWKKYSNFQLSKYISYKFLIIPWGKKVYKTIQYLDFFDQKINQKIVEWFKKVDFYQLLTHPDAGIRTFAKNRIIEKNYWAQFKRKKQ